MTRTKKGINKDAVNIGIPDNIDDFVTWLTDQNIKYYDFELSSNEYKLKKFKEFIKTRPDILQYKLF